MNPTVTLEINFFDQNSRLVLELNGRYPTPATDLADDEENVARLADQLVREAYRRYRKANQPNG